MRRSVHPVLAAAQAAPLLLSFAVGGARAAEPANARSANAAQDGVSANVAEAERLAALAFDAYGRKDYPGAVALYERALGAARSADILYNLARVYDVGLHDGGHAIEYYRLYLAEPKALPPRTEFAARRISELLPPPSEPALSGASLGAEPAPGNAQTPKPLGPASGWTWRETTTAALAGGGVVALGVGLAFGISAYAGSDDWQDECDGNACRSQRGVDAARSASSRARVATVALTASGTLLAGAAAVWWFGSPESDRASHVAVRLAPLGNGAELACSFSGQF